MKINKQKLDRYLFNKYSLHIGAILLGVIGLYLMNLYNDYFKKKEQEEYKKDIIDTHNELNGYIIDYSMSKVYAGTKLATLSTGDKFFVSTTPYDRSGYSLFDCLRQGDHLYKPSNTDSIFVTKPDGRKFFFMAYWKYGSN